MVAEDTQTKQGKWPSPFAYYRELRPQYFSDTVVRYEVPLTQELFDLQLALLSTKKMQSVFENFIVAIAKRNITPNIKPQTGPDGGGDGKVDAEQQSSMQMQCSRLLQRAHSPSSFRKLQQLRVADIDPFLKVRLVRKLTVDSKEFDVMGANEEFDG